MRVGIFTDQYYPSISGVVTSIKMLYEGLTALEHEVFIFTSFDKEMVTDPSELKGMNVVNLPGRSYPFRDLKEYKFNWSHRHFAKQIIEYNLDVIHIHTEFNIAKIARVVGKKLNIPIVHTFHTLYEDYLKYVSGFFDRHFHNVMLSSLAKMFIKPVSKSSVIEIVPTKKVLALVHRYHMKGDIRVIPTGIQLERFYKSNFKVEDRKALREKLGIRPEQFVFAYIGRTSREKNIEVIIEAYSKVKCKDNSVLLIVGGGPELSDLKECARINNVEQNIIFTDFVEWECIPLYYQIADIFVNASKSETQGLTYIESLASSIPVLVQKDECIEDVVQDYYNGIYFDGEVELTQKMEEIQKAPTTLKKIKANTQKSVAKYSKEQYARNVEAVYLDAIAIYSDKILSKKRKKAR